MHSNLHPMANHNVYIDINVPDDKNATSPLIAELQGKEYRIEDWWDSDMVGERSWTIAASQGNPACVKYLMRAQICGLPLDDEVVYGKVGNLGHLIHVSELGEEVF